VEVRHHLVERTSRRNGHEHNPRCSPRFLGELQRTRSRQELGALHVAPILRNHAFGGAYDREAWLGIEKGFIAAFPDVHLEVLAQVTEGDLSATRVAMTGTQKDEFYGSLPLVLSEHCE